MQGDTIDIQYNNKNYQPLMTNGDLKYLTLQHRHSFITPQQAISKIIGQFCRMARTVNSPLNLIKATFEFIIIAKHLQYKDHEIKQAILKMCHKNIYQHTWTQIYNLFSMYRINTESLFFQLALKTYS